MTSSKFQFSSRSEWFESSDPSRKVLEVGWRYSDRMSSVSSTMIFTSSSIFSSSAVSSTSGTVSGWAGEVKYEPPAIATLSSKESWFFLAAFFSPTSELFSNELFASFSSSAISKAYFSFAAEEVVEALARRLSLRLEIYLLEAGSAPSVALLAFIWFLLSLKDNFLPKFGSWWRLPP